MFSYSLPELTKKINTKRLSMVMTVMYILSVMPLLVLGHFNWLSADDMSMAYEAHEYLIGGGSAFGFIFEVLRITLDEYMTWVGYFFSATLSSLCPGIFGEKLYFLVVYEIIGILTLGVCYFFNALFVHGFKGDKHLANVAAMLTLMVLTQSMPAGMVRVEAFYWHSGAINYMFMLGLGLFWVGLLIRAVYDKADKRRGKLIWACIWGFLLGGTNYMTALELAIISVLVLIILVLSRISFIKLENVSDEQKKYVGLLWIPACLNLLGFVLSCLAPGNRVRGSQVEGFGAIKSIMIAIYDVFDICVNEYTRWEVIVALMILVPVFWKLSESIEHRFEHPFIFTLFALGMTASNMVPPLFATANIEAGRIQSIIWGEYVVMLVLITFYVTAWVRQNLAGSGEKDVELSVRSSTWIFALVFILAFGSILCIKADPHYYSVTSACADIVSGDAYVYRSENLSRLQTLKDTSVTDVVLDEYSVKPQMLFFSDIEDDTQFWINTVVARYYHKNSVLLRKN
ncbi:MAG: hypothetical protein IJI01_08535 [Butyrivibrio sp.]|uniref:DUF6056 family protein n=1 Tax=Butyrivibrio sp. TaxID=28121 RepID=UPI0025BA2E1B|nr:DUF6056 family protein [Butyrivibrio sp.]MBQ6588711.1 hypothetical protein [Butyrivibrio sp.]